MNNEVTQIPERTDPRRTITQCAAALSIWADQHRGRAPQLAWQEFDEQIDELNAAVPGQGALKDVMKFYTARAIFALVADELGRDDMTDLELAMKSAMVALDEAVEP